MNAHERECNSSIEDVNIELVIINVCADISLNALG